MYGRSDGSDVITKPKFLALMGLPKSLSYGAPLARALRRARELRYKAINASRFFVTSAHFLFYKYINIISLFLDNSICLRLVNFSKSSIKSPLLSRFSDKKAVLKSTSTNSC